MNFHTYAQDFTPVSVEQASQLLTAQEGAILFLGRASCPYCNRFIPKLHAVAQEHKLTVYFLDTEQPTVAISDLRNRYGVATVPGLLYAGSDGVSVRCDSSMSPEEIAHFVGV